MQEHSIPLDDIRHEAALPARINFLHEAITLALHMCEGDA